MTFIDKNIAQPHSAVLWHNLSADAVLSELETNAKGLDKATSRSRLKEYGKNRLPAQKLLSIWQLILNQLINPLIFILAIAAIAAILIGEYTDTIFIIIVIEINTALGTWQEYNAQKNASELQKLLRIKARVLRKGKPRTVSAEYLAPGDIVLLESGVKVPADLRLLEAHSLSCDESFLTGESIPASKNTDSLPDDVSVNDMRNMAFAGATVNSGRGVGIVVATGLRTQVGKIAESVTEADTAKPPLVVRMEQFSLKIGLAVVVMSVVIGVLLHLQGYDWAGIFFFIVALTVSAIPEGLPVAVTVALSVASRRMSKRNVIVRRLNAVESLGSCTIIASDKTGTLTVNQQTARLITLPDGKSFKVTGEGYNGEGEIQENDGSRLSANSKELLQPLMIASILANEGTLQKRKDGWQHHGDSMDVAFLSMAAKSGLDTTLVQKEYNITGSVPYESELKYAATFYESEGNTYASVKGAVETVLGFCSNAYPQKSLDHESLTAQAHAMAQNGFRVLAAAGGKVHNFKPGESNLHHLLKDLEIYGLVGFIDPLRAETTESVRRAHLAGIEVLMITGDHPATAGAIAKELGLFSPAKQNIITGMELTSARDESLEKFNSLVLSGSVFARVSPIQKLEVVDALINSGQFVAVTGDGVNDTPALRRANIGVAMGSGTDAAKETGSMIIVDDDFSSIVAGVEEGRFAYGNVRKVIYLLVSTGAAEVFLFVTCVITQLPMPLLAVQILWLNLVTNGIQHLALSFEPGEKGAMIRPPRRPNEPIFNKLMLSETVISGLAMGAITYAAWYTLTQVQGVQEDVARNLVLMLFVLLQNVHVFNCRSETTSIFRMSLRKNPLVIAAVILAQGIHLLSMQIPVMQKTLSLAPIAPVYWLNMLGSAVVLLIVMEVFKWVNRKYLRFA